MPDDRDDDSMDAMREMILGLEHTAANPIVVDEEETMVAEDGSKEVEICERASCYARANLPGTVPKSRWSWPVAICEGSVPTCTVVSPNTMGVHVPRRLYACPMKTEVPD